MYSFIYMLSNNLRWHRLKIAWQR